VNKTKKEESEQQQIKNSVILKNKERESECDRGCFNMNWSAFIFDMP
jgi:hypothetical protein